MSPARKSTTDEGGLSNLSSSTTSGSPGPMSFDHDWRLIKRNVSAGRVYKLLIFLPFGVLFGFLDWNPVAVFFFNLLAILPLAVLLSAFTEELSGSFRQSVGALLNATFGNAVELIVSLWGSAALDGPFPFC